MRIIPVDQPEVSPLTMPDRFRQEIVFFMTPAGDRTAPSQLGAKEYWIEREDALGWLDAGEFCIVSPLDAANKTQIELTDYQETWLEWLVKHNIQRVSVE